MYRSRGLETDGAPSPVLPALRRRKADDHLGGRVVWYILYFSYLHRVGKNTNSAQRTRRKSTLRVLFLLENCKSI